MKPKKQKKILGYKVRNPETGLYLSSVSSDKWTKIGKVWPRRCDVFRAINCALRAASKYSSFNNNKAENIFENSLKWEIVELTEESTTPLIYYINRIKL